MSPQKTPGLIFGAAPLGKVDNPNAKIRTEAEAEPVMAYLRANGVTTLDTARGYPPSSPGKSEEFLGDIDAASWATIDTKVASFTPGDHSAASIAKSVAESLAALKTSKVHILYLHAPERSTPFAETLRAIDKEYRAGRFEKFGISNYTAAEVEELIKITEAEGLVKPSVYQGQYNAIFRGNEKELFPVLRKHNMAFYAYTPAAAGLLSGNVTREDAKRSGSRWDNNTQIGALYRKMYFKDSVFDAVGKVSQASKELGLDGHGVAVRWVLFHSLLDGAYGDKVIIGASNVKHLTSYVDAEKAGPLPAELLPLLANAWTVIEPDSGPYHF